MNKHIFFRAGVTFYKVNHGDDDDDDEAYVFYKTRLWELMVSVVRVGADGYCSSAGGGKADTEQS